MNDSTKMTLDTLDYNFFSNSGPLVVIAGVNVLESEQLAHEVASQLVEHCSLPLVFKGSFDKANRSSLNSYRGPGLDKGLQILSDIRTKYNIPVITDIHEPHQAEMVSEVVDILQIPAFLCRQTDLLIAAGKTNKIINIKKGQFLAPSAMQYPVEKIKSVGNNQVLICERGTQFGYNNLIVDFLGFEAQKSIAPLIFDVTHALQLPGAGDTDGVSGGRADQVQSLMAAAIIQGIAGLFFETHPDPSNAKCDGPSALPIKQLPEFLRLVTKIEMFTRSIRLAP